MRIARGDIERKVVRVVAMLRKQGLVPEGRRHFLSVMNMGDGISRYQLCWSPEGRYEENPVGYSFHVRGRQLYHFLEGLEEGLAMAGASRPALLGTGKHQEWGAMP